MAGTAPVRRRSKEESPIAVTRKRIKRAGFDSIIPNVAPEIITADTPKAQWLVISPAVAIKWLEEANTSNRRIRDDHVAKLAADMITGKWQGRNAETIGFDTNCRLVDGQHRLWACVQADKPMEALVVTGLDPECYATKGIGAKKSLADFLGPLNGEKNATLLASSLRLVWQWQNRKLSLSSLKSASTPTIAQMREVYKEHPNLPDSVQAVVKMTDLKKVYNQTFAVLIHYAGTLENKHARVTAFLERLASGLGLLDTDPVYHLRKFCLEQKGARPGFRRHGREHMLALGIKAFNLAKEEKAVRSLRFSPNEEFPQL